MQKLLFGNSGTTKMGCLSWRNYLLYLKVLTSEVCIEGMGGGGGIASVDAA